MRIRLPIFLLFVILYTGVQAQRLRPLADTIGFAHTAVQMDTFMNRVMRQDGEKILAIQRKAGVSESTAWKCAISPHDDYTYSGYTYPLVLQNIKAKTVIIFGVAHKARLLGLENKLIFDAFDEWQGPYGNVRVSPMREKIIRELPEGIFEINDSMQVMEHSVEAEVPFLQYYNRDVEIISILVPYMSFDRMKEIAEPWAEAVAKLMRNEKLEWGKDLAILISNDAVHYGNEDWGGNDFARFGVDGNGYDEALRFEHNLIDECLTGELTLERILKFTRLTVDENDFRKYKWTWCGRYSVPMGLAATYFLAKSLGEQMPSGICLDYNTSLGAKHIPVEDLGGMGVTASAWLKHWVGYVSMGYQ